MRAGAFKSSEYRHPDGEKLLNKNRWLLIVRGSAHAGGDATSHRARADGKDFSNIIRSRRTPSISNRRRTSKWVSCHRLSSGGGTIKNIKRRLR
jgi:hypothetical protein